MNPLQAARKGEQPHHGKQQGPGSSLGMERASQGSWAGTEPKAAQQHTTLESNQTHHFFKKQLFSLASPAHLQLFHSDLETYFPLPWHFRHSYHLCLMLHRERTCPCSKVYALNSRNNEASRQMLGWAWGKLYWFCSFIPLVAGRTCHRRTNSHKWGRILDCLFASVIITLDGRQRAVAFAWSRATFWLLGNSKP